MVDVPRGPGRRIWSYGHLQRVTTSGSAALRCWLETQPEASGRTCAGRRAEPQPRMGRQRRTALSLVRERVGPHTRRMGGAHLLRGRGGEPVGTVHDRLSAMGWGEMEGSAATSLHCE